MLHQPSGRNGPSPQRRKYINKYDQIVPSSPQASRPSGVTIVGRTTATATLTTTHNHCAQAGRNTIGTWLCTRPPTSRLCGHARRRSTSTPPAMDKQHTHTAKTIALCALQRPTCPQSSAIERHQTGMYPQQRKDNGDQSTIWRGHTRPTTSPKDGKGGGTSAKGSVLILTCVPLPHLVLPLSGCAISGTPTKATRGEARGHPW